MFEKVFTEPHKLNEAIDTLMDVLLNETPGTKEYATLVDLLTKLYKLKEIDTNLKLKEYDSDDKQRTNEVQCELTELEIEKARRELKIPFGLKPETLATVVANLLGIVMITQHERLNIVTTKAVSFVMKLKN